MDTPATTTIEGRRVHGLSTGALHLDDHATGNASLLGRLERLDIRVRQLEDNNKTNRHQHKCFQIIHPASVAGDDGDDRSWVGYHYHSRNTCDVQLKNELEAERMQRIDSVCGASRLSNEDSSRDIMKTTTQQQQRSSTLNPNSNNSSNCTPLSSVLKETHLNGTLLDRLHLLESRVRQLSHELDLNNNSSAATTWTGRRMESRSAATAAPFPIVLHGQSRGDDYVATDQSRTGINKVAVTNGGGSAPWRDGCFFHRGARDLREARKSKRKSKDRAILEAAGKRANNILDKEKRRLDRTRIYRRWFAVGC